MIVVHCQKAAELAHTDGAQVSTIAAHSLGPSEPIHPTLSGSIFSQPTAAEDRKCEIHLGIDVQTRSDITMSNKPDLLYAERGARYLSAQVLATSGRLAAMDRVTFILTDQCDGLCSLRGV